MTVKDDTYRNVLFGQFETCIKEELFQTLSPGLANNPSDAFDRVSQDVTDPWGILFASPSMLTLQTSSLLYSA